MPKKENIAIAVGGSILFKDEINEKYLKKFITFIKSIKSNYHKIFIVVGGGKVCRNYQNSVKKLNKKISNTDLDWLGIRVTQLNAYYLIKLFKGLAYEEVVFNPTKKIITSKKILIAGGYKPGASTDYDLVLLAQTYGINELVNLTNIDYIYDKDPHKYRSAKPFYNMSWNDLQSLVGTTWQPGKNTPFDPKATQLGKKLNIKMVTMLGEDINNFKNYLQNKKFKGTIVCN